MASMDLDLKNLKDLPLRLKVVLGVLAVELLILLTGYLILDDVMADRIAQIDQIRANLTQLRRKNAQLRQDFERYPGLRQQHDAAMAAGLGNPLDRAAVVNSARDWSDRLRLSELRYRLMPDSAKPAVSGRYMVENDLVEFECNALLDTDVAQFWQTMMAQQPGHYRVAAFELERTRDLDDSIITSVRRGVYPALLRAKIDLVWTGIQPNIQASK